MAKNCKILYDSDISFLFLSIQISMHILVIIFKVFSQNEPADSNRNNNNSSSKTFQHKDIFS